MQPLNERCAHYGAKLRSETECKFDWRRADLLRRNSHRRARKSPMSSSRISLPGKSGESSGSPRRRLTPILLAHLSRKPKSARVRSLATPPPARVLYGQGAMESQNLAHRIAHYGQNSETYVATSVRSGFPVSSGLWCRRQLRAEVVPGRPRPT